MEWVENKFTQSLEMSRRSLAVYRGWSDEWLSCVVALRRMQNKPYVDVSRQNVAGETKKLNEWYREKERIAYFLGQQATVVAFAHFTLDRQSGREPSHLFDVEVYDPTLDKEIPQAFLQAIHYDLMTRARYEGDIWSEVDKKDTEKLQLLQQTNYKKQAEFGKSVLMLRKGIGRY